MRRIAITTLASAALALAPGVALARGHHHAHLQRGHHAHVRTERFGPAITGAPSANPSDNAGTVASFVNSVLTLRLNDGSTVSGAVGDQTEIKCQAPEPNAQMADHGGDGGSDGSNSTSGDETTTHQTAPTTQSTEPNEDANDNEAADPSDNDAAANENEDQQAGACSTSSLVPGEVVREAELRVSSTGAAFKDIELVK